MGLALLVVTGCASTRAYTPDPAHPFDPGYFELVRVDLTRDEVGRLLLAHYQEWAGVPHRLGGASKAGVDCSGFAQITYRDLFGLALPRTTGDMVRMGVEVGPRSLRPGDLVFFRPPGQNHVGIMLGPRRFVHASTSQGIIISNLGDDYWWNHYWIARRIVRTRD